MAEVSQRRLVELLRIVIDTLWGNPAGLSARDVLTRVTTTAKLSEYESSFFPSTNTPRYERVIRLSLVPIVRAGWLVIDRDRWSFTEQGRRACKNYRNAEEFFIAAVRKYNEQMRLRDELSLTLEDAEEKAWTQIWQYLYSKNPIEFRQLVIDLLRVLGYRVVWVAPPEKDRGYVDLVAYQDPLGSDGTQIKVHVLHTGQVTTVEGLRAFMSVLGAGDIGVFVSSGGFTDSALEEARLPEQQKIRLIYKENFLELWVENYGRLSDEARRRLPLTPVYFLAPPE